MSIDNRDYMHNRRVAKFSKQHPELRSTYLKTLQLLGANPAHPSLRLHALCGKFEGLHSMSINLSYRITLELLIQDQQIIPVNLGDHDTVCRFAKALGRHSLIN